MRFVLALCLFVIVVLAPLTALAGDVRFRVAGVVPFPADRNFLDRQPSDAVRRPAWLNQTLWEQLVFNGRDMPASLNGRRTHVLTPDQILNLDVYVQLSPNDPDLESALAAKPLLERFFWDVINSFSGHQWGSRFDMGTRVRELRDGIVRMRDGTSEEFADKPSTIAYAETWRYEYPDGTFAKWAYTDIVVNPDPPGAPEDPMELARWGIVVFAHELGHALGFSHVDNRNSLLYPYIYAEQTFSDTEILHAQLAYDIGPGVLFPGLIQPTATAPGDLTEGVKDLVDEALEDLQDDSGGRQATETVPALPTAGVLLLATLLVLLGRRRLRAG